MSSSNRVLRERRLKDYSTTEIIDGESYGGFRSQQQKSNPETQQTNANARILMKFLNQINRSKLFSYPSGLPSQILKNQTHEPAKRKMVKTEHMLGKTSNTESNKVESYKKNHPSRTPYSNKSSMIPETSKQQKEIKEMNLDKNKKSNESQKLTFCSNGPMESKFNTAEYMKMWSRIQEEKRTIGKKNEQQLMNKLQQRQKKSIQDELKKNGPLNDLSTMDESHLEEKGIKYFKRQTYHVAVAYHIHVKHSNQNQLNSLDPTYNAKKLKEKSKKND